ncbi:MAG TPA: hypothetical protein PK350_12320 [Deltaproteobacteria bacterium]|nr:hypothetical protein [Deltaproteobacteria bacterium]HPR55385.1 hypothetical protein [Deltaproteobacteria bacterium]
MENALHDSRPFEPCSITGYGELVGAINLIRSRLMPQEVNSIWRNP